MHFKVNKELTIEEAHSLIGIIDYRKQELAKEFQNRIYLKKTNETAKTAQYEDDPYMNNLKNMMVAYEALSNSIIHDILDKIITAHE